MSVRNRKYRTQSIEEIAKEFVSKSKSSIQSLLLHYKLYNDTEMFNKLKTAYEIAKIERAKLKLRAREDEITFNTTK